MNKNLKLPFNVDKVTFFWSFAPEDISFKFWRPPKLKMDLNRITKTLVRTFGA